MKIFYFNPNDYGDQFFVLAKDKTQAHECLLKHLEKKIVEEACYSESYKKDLEIWSKVNPLDAETFPEKYTLDEHEEGSVIQTELC